MYGLKNGTEHYHTAKEMETDAFVWFICHENEVKVQNNNKI